MGVDDANTRAMIRLVRDHIAALDSAGGDDTTVEPWAVDRKKPFDELIVFHAGIQ